MSDKSKVEIHDIVEEINKNVWSNGKNITGKVTLYYQGLVEQVRTEIKSVVIFPYKFGYDESEAQTFSSKFNSGTKIISSLAEELNNKSIEEVAVKINSTITSLGIQVPESYVLNIANGGKYFSFLELVSNKKLNTRQWGELFKDTLMYLSESKENIQREAEEKARYINKLLNDSSKSIHRHYDGNMNILEIQRLPDELSQAITVMEDLKKTIDSVTPSTELLEVMQKINSLINNLALDIKKSGVLVIVNRKKYLHFLQAVSGVNLKSETLPWTCPVEDAISYLSESLKWYKYLNSLYSKLSEYEIQRSRSRYDVADIDDWGKDDKPQGITISPNNFKKFLDKTAEFNIKAYNAIKSTDATELKIEELNRVLNLGLKQRIHEKCEEPHIFIMGQFISIEDISTKINNSSIKCWGTSTDKTYKFINIFALNTVFIDQQLSLPGRELSITIIAPKWEVIGSREIDLHGAEGSNVKETSSDSPWGSICSGRNGTDGIPGEPGGPGGSFFGMTEHIDNGKDLTITTNGGVGGPGTDGKEGNCGKDGDSAVPPEERTLCSSMKCDGTSYCKYVNGSYENVAPHPESPGGSSTSILYYYMEFFGKPGIIGGRGGDGGRGGEGGKPGDIILFELNSSSGVLKQKSPGKEGKGGIGGQEGKGGRNGDSLVMSCASTFSTSIFGTTEISHWRKQKTINGIDLGTRGNGADGANTKNLKSPKSANTIQIVSIINEYKQYVRNNINNRLNKHPLIAFLNHVDSNNNVINIYDTLGFVGELQGLEAQFHNLKGVDLLPFYESLLKRISEYARRPEKSQNSLEQKKVLSYLYTAILGRIQNYKDSLDSNLIINVTEFIDSIKHDLDALKDLQNFKKKYDVIKKYKREYENKLFAKVEEAKNFIEKDILPEIEKAGDEVGTRLQSLIDEVKDAKDKTEKEQKDLIEKRKKIEKYMILHGMFGLLNVFGQALSVLGPMGMVAGSAVSFGSTVGDTVTLMTEDNPEIRFLKLPKGASDLETIKVQIKSIRDKKITDFQKLLDHVSQEIEKDPDAFGEVVTKVTEIKDKLSKESEKEFSYKDFKNVDNLKKELNDVLGSKEAELKESMSNPKARNTVKVIDKLKKTIELGSAAAETFIRFKNDQVKVNEVNKAIKAAGDKLNKLKEYEHNIYTTMAPMLQNVISGLNDVQSKLGTKSKVSLDITKWKVQTTLSDMKVQMSLLTEEYKSKDYLIRSIEKLGDAMTTLIGVYDHIQDFQDQQTLAVYIADISSAAADEIDIGNEELRDAVRKLEITIRSSIVLQRYKVAVDAFKQFVFPFAHTYFKDIELPTHLRLDWKEGNNALENLVQKTKTEIDQIKSIQKNYKVSVTKTDSQKGSGEFSSRFVPLRPFFTWKNEFHKNMISKLLSGQEVAVYADVTNSPPDKDAIKFKVIDLQFKARNETLQSKINKVLEGFQISATHLGNSYYRYNDKIYVITTNSIPIWYLFKKENNVPVHRAGVYDKIKDGEFMLSPYASWKIKLTNVTKSISFDSLKIFKDDIDLELGGFGHYLNKMEFNNLHLKVDEYYTTVQTLNQNELVEEEDTVFLFKHDESSKNKREVDNVIENLVHATQDEILEMGNMATNSGVHTSSLINSVFNWFKTRSIALVSSILPVKILDNKETASENNDAECYYKYESFVGTVLKEIGFETEKALDDRGCMGDYLEPQVFESTGEESTNAYTAEADHVFMEYGPDYDFSQAPLLDIEAMRNYTSCIGASEYINSKLFLSAGEKVNSSQIIPGTIEGWGSLMLADVMIRSMNKEKYEQYRLAATTPALEKTIELHHLEEKVKNGLQKMSFLFGGHGMDSMEFPSEEMAWRW